MWLLILAGASSLDSAASNHRKRALLSLITLWLPTSCSPSRSALIVRDKPVVSVLLRRSMHTFEGQGRRTWHQPRLYSPSSFPVLPNLEKDFAICSNARVPFQRRHANLSFSTCL